MALEWASVKSTGRGVRRIENPLEQLSGEEIQSLAALAGVADRVAELVFATWPSAMREWAQSRELIHCEGAEVRITDLGWRTIEAAAIAYPRPFADVDMRQIMRKLARAMSELPATGIVTSFRD